MKFERLQSLWQQATPLKRALLVGVPVVVLALAGAGIGFAAMHGGGGSGQPQVEAAPTDEDTATALPMWPTAVATETPSSAGLQATSDTQPVTSTGRRAQAQTGTGPGSAQATGWELTIPAIGVDASVYSRSVGTNGQMGNPLGAWDAIWYDFSEWGGLGGAPGEPGANAVFAGHVDYINIGPAVFWSIRDLSPGDRITVTTDSGPITYAVQWTKWADPEDDFTQFVTRTGEQSITLVTCVGDFSAGHYSNRLIVRGVRV